MAAGCQAFSAACPGRRPANAPLTSLGADGGTVRSFQEDDDVVVAFLKQVMFAFVITGDGLSCDASR